eukprot:2036078-Amphidinium_carterae.1
MPPIMSSSSSPLNVHGLEGWIFLYGSCLNVPNDAEDVQTECGYESCSLKRCNTKSVEEGSLPCS